MGGETTVREAVMQTRKSYRQEKDAFDFTGGVDFRSTLMISKPGREKS